MVVLIAGMTVLMRSYASNVRVVICITIFDLDISQQRKSTRKMSMIVTRTMAGGQE
jgi:hypothetical protein